MTTNDAGISMKSQPLSVRTSRSTAWSIVGTGTMAEHFAADLRLVEGAHLAAVTSRSHDKAEEFAARHGCTAYCELPALLDDKHVDAVYIATPNDTHYKTAYLALLAGKHVLVEKPLVTARADAEHLAATAAKQNLLLMEALWTRCLPSILYAHQMVQSGALGKIRRIYGELAYPHRYEPTNRFFDPARGGGALLDLGCYLVSLSLALLGRPDKINGSWRPAANGVDVAADIRLTFGETEAHLACGFDRLGANLFLVEGEQSALILQPPFIGARMVVEAHRGLSALAASSVGTSILARAMRKATRMVPLPGVQRHSFDFAGYGLQFEIAEATRAIAAGQTQSPLVPLSDSVETLDIIEQIRGKPPMEARSAL